MKSISDVIKPWWLNWASKINTPNHQADSEETIHEPLVISPPNILRMAFSNSGGPPWLHANQLSWIWIWKVCLFQTIGNILLSCCVQNQKIPDHQYACSSFVDTYGLPEVNLSWLRRGYQRLEQCLKFSMLAMKRTFGVLYVIIYLPALFLVGWWKVWSVSVQALSIIIACECTHFLNMRAMHAKCLHAAWGPVPAGQSLSVFTISPLSLQLILHQ